MLLCVLTRQRLLTERYRSGIMTGMIDQAERAVHLALLLRQQHEAIATAWAERIYHEVDAHYAEQSLEEIRASTRWSLHAIIAVLQTGSDAAVEEYLASLSRDRLCQHFAIGEVLDALLLCKEVALPILVQTSTLERAETCDLIAHLDTCLRGIISRFGQRYAVAMQQHLHEQQQCTARMLGWAQGTGESPALEHVLQRMAERIAAVVGVQGCTIYLLESEQGRCLPQVAAEPWASICPEVLRTYPLDPGTDVLFRELIEQQRPVVCCNAQTDARLSRETRRVLGITSLLAVPIQMNGPVLGIALLYTCDDYRTFTSAEIETVWSIAGALALAVENDRLSARMRQQLAESQCMQQMTTALLHTLELDDVLEIVCSHAQQFTNALGSSVFLVEDDGWLWRALSTGEALPRSDRIPVQGSLTGAAVLRREPVLINAPGPEAKQLCWGSELTTLLVVPLCVPEGVIGALSVVNKPGGFTSEDMRIISLFADQSAIAIENARLAQQVEHLAVMEERQRLARELHDSVTQALYSVTLHSEAAVRLLSAGKQAAAVEYMRDLRTTAQQALREMRLLIFELRPPILEQEGLVAALQARLDAVEGRAGLQTELRIHGEEKLHYTVAEELYRIAQEALNNVLKHAHAHHVTLQITCEEANCCLEISDDGEGFDTAAMLQHDGWGLRGMQERARRVGAELSVNSVPGQGTTVRVLVKQQSERAAQRPFSVLEHPAWKQGES
jgi:signal transduction histidine kinase